MQELIDIFLAYKTSIVGGILVACFGAYLAWRNGHKARRANACAAFRSSVLNIFIGIYPEPKDWPSDGNSVDRKLQSIFPALQTAVENFRPFVPWLSRRGFNRAWSIYLHGSEANSGSHYYQYMGYSSPDVEIPDSKATFKANVERLLSYAKET